jgi:hypothetical protein
MRTIVVKLIEIPNLRYDEFEGETILDEKGAIKLVVGTPMETD